MTENIINNELQKYVAPFTPHREPTSRYKTESLPWTLISVAGREKTIQCPFCTALFRAWSGSFQSTGKVCPTCKAKATADGRSHQRIGA